MEKKDLIPTKETVGKAPKSLKGKRGADILGITRTGDDRGWWPFEQEQQVMAKGRTKPLQSLLPHYLFTPQYVPGA